MQTTRHHELDTAMARRAFLRRLVTAGGALSLTALAAACGANKASSASTTSGKAATTGAPTTAAAPTTAVASPTTAKAASSVASLTTAAPAATTPATVAPAGTMAAKPAVGGKTFDATKEVVIAYSYVADTTGQGGGGRINNPYIAVWIEGADGSIVRNVSVSYQVGRGDRWLNELRRWFSAEQAYVAKGGPASIQTISSATRVPGASKVVWDGLDEKKQPVAFGDYFVCIEASRERGPYQIVRESVAIGAEPAVKTLADNGELQKVSVELRARG